MDKKLIAFAALLAFAMVAMDVSAKSITLGGAVYVIEDGKQILAENAKSLKDKGIYRIVYTQIEEKFGLEVLDFNATTITLKTNISKDFSKYDGFKDVKISVKEKTYDKTAKKITETKTVLKQLRQDDFKETPAYYYDVVTLNASPIGKSFSFGGNSTTVQLEDTTTEYLDDVTLHNGQGNQDAIGVIETQVEAGNYVFKGIFKFNASVIPAGSTVTNATWCGYTSETYGTFTGLTTYHITNQTWAETTATYASSPLSLGQYNTTKQTNYFTTAGLGDTVWICLDVTNGFKKDVADGNANTSFAIYNESSVGAVADTYFRDREYATTSLRPYVNVTYEAGAPPASVDWINVKISSPANATITGWYNISLMVNGSNSSSNVSLFVRGGNITGEQGIYNGSKPYWITFNQTTLNIAFYQSNGAFNITAYAFNGTNTDTDTVFYTQALPLPQITVYSPGNSSYTDSYVVLNVSVSAYTGNISNPWIWWAKDGVWNQTHGTLNPLDIFGTSGADCDGSCRRSSLNVNIPIGGAHNITIASKDYGTYATNWTVIYFSFLTYSNVTYGTLPTFINETRPLSLSVDYVYNPNLITNITTKFYVDSQAFDMANSKNATNVLNTYSYNVPLVALNNTQKDLIYETTIRYINGSLEYFNSSTYNYNVTYIAYLSSVDTGSAQYLEGAPIDSILYAYNYTNAVTMSVSMDLTYNASRNLTYAVSSFSGTTLRAYEYDFPGHTPSNNTENVTLTGTAVITYGSTSRTMTTTASADIYKFNITNCTEGTPSLIISFFNETNFTATTGYLPIVYISATSGTITREYSFFNLTENDTFQFCMSPSWANPTADIYVSYSKAGAPVREYYANNVTLTSTPSYINAYILGTAEAYYTNIYVYDENGAKYPNVYVKVLKMNPATAVYTTMFIGKTDSEGIMPTYLYPLTQPYKFFILDSENELIYQTDAESIPCLSSCPPYEKHINIETTLTGQIDFGGITSIFSYDNATRAMSISISDDEGLAENIMISIWSLSDFGGRALYYNSTTNSSAISYSTILSDANSEYLLVVSVMENGEYYPYRQESMIITRNQPFGVIGGMMAIFIVLGLSAFGFVVFEHIGGLVGCGLGIVLCSQYVLRLLPIDAIGISGLLVVLAIIAYTVSRD